MSQPLISVIVPVYNAEAFLDECVASIRAQSYSNLEIILVDDGSPDHCGEICDRLAQEDSRIRVLHKKNGGLSSARNAGLDIATGSCVSFVDSDDWIRPDMYQCLYTLMQRHSAQIAAGGIQTDTGVCYNRDYPRKQDIEVYSRLDALREVTKNKKITNSFCDKLFHKSLFESLRFPVGEYFEDMKTIHKCLELADTIVYTPQPFYIYRMTPESISRGAFHPRLFEDAYAAKARAAYYSEKYPEISCHAAAHYIDVYLIRIWMSRNTPSCAAQREAMIQELKGPLPSGAVKCLSYPSRLKLFALRIGTPFFYMLMRIVELIKKP